MIPAVFSLAGPSLTRDERAFFTDADPAGYVLFARNCHSRAQLRALSDDLRALHGRERLFIAVDQEGGRVARLGPPDWPAYPAAGVLAKGWTRAPASAIAAMRAHAEAIGWDLAEAGISVDFWPCLDLAFADGHGVIGDRALGAAPRQVAALGRAALEGLAAAGVAGVIKHLPGHGRARADSHLALPVITADEAALARDLAPFQALCQADAGVSPALPARIAMTGHLLIPAWDAANPATLSPFIIDAVIRRRIGFGGLLVSDDLDMKALSGPVAERAARAIAAGCDLALNCWGRLDDMIAIAQALPAMREASAARLAHALARTDVPRAPDPAARQALIATRDALIASWQAL